MKSQLRKVFIIDDEPEYSTIYVDDLEDHSVKVTHYTDARLARQHLRAHAEEYDVIVVDLIMPYISPGSEEEAIPDEDELPPDAYIEGGLAMGRWVLDAIPTSRKVLVLTNREPDAIRWTEEYRSRFDTFEIVTKRDCPAFQFYDYLVDFLEGDLIPTPAAT